VVTARAQLRNTPEREQGGGPIRPEDGRTVERVFTVSQPAAENRVSAIVAAFDLATRDINTQVVDWTIQSAPAPLTAPR
jgi:cholesterol transport system auxiliary component